MTFEAYFSRSGKQLIATGLPVFITLPSGLFLLFHYRDTDAALSILLMTGFLFLGAILMVFFMVRWGRIKCNVEVTDAFLLIHPVSNSPFYSRDDLRLNWNEISGALFHQNEEAGTFSIGIATTGKAKKFYLQEKGAESKNKDSALWKEIKAKVESKAINK